jgi:hypothetical protein
MGMDMDIWYELRLREMSGLNEGVDELLREAEQALLGAAAAPEDEEQ